MFGVDIYILLFIATVILIGVGLAIYSLNKLYLILIPFSLSSLAASLFYTNEPIWISGEIETGIGGYLRAGLLFISGLIGIIYYLKHIRIHHFRFPLHLVFLLLFILFSLFSTFYTIDTKATLTRSTLFFTLFLSLIGLNYWLDTKEKFSKFISTLFYIVSIVLFLNLISMVAIPGRSWWWKTPSRLLGILSHPNELGGLCLVSFPIIFWKLKNSESYEKYLAWLVLAITFIVLVATGSRTSLFVSIIGMIIWLVVHKDWIKFAILTIILVIAVIFISQIGLSSYTRDEGSKLTDLTERELIWQGASVFLKEKPIFGYGYSVEGKIFDNQLLFDMTGQFFNPNSQQPLHNGYLSIFIGGGIIGLALWLFAIMIPIYYSIKYLTDKSIVGYVLATLIPILIANIVESAITGYLSATDIYFWLAWLIGGKAWTIFKNDPEDESILIKEAEYASK